MLMWNAKKHINILFESIIFLKLAIIIRYINEKS